MALSLQRLPNNQVCWATPKTIHKCRVIHNKNGVKEGQVLRSERTLFQDSKQRPNEHQSKSFINKVVKSNTKIYVQPTNEWIKEGKTCGSFIARIPNELFGKKKKKIWKSSTFTSL